MAEGILVNCQSIVDSTNHLLTSYQRYSGEDANTLNCMEESIFSNIESIKKLIMEAEIYSLKESSQTRQTINFYINQAKGDISFLETTFNRIRNQKQTAAQAKLDREKLFHRNISQQPDTSLNIQEEYDAKIKYSELAVDQMIDTGQNILSSLRYQRGFINSASQGVKKLATSLGVSDSTIRMIERRFIDDKIIFIVLGVFSLLFMYFIIRLFK